MSSQQTPFEARMDRVTSAVDELVGDERYPIADRDEFASLVRDIVDESRYRLPNGVFMSLGDGDGPTRPGSNPSRVGSIVFNALADVRGDDRATVERALSEERDREERGPPEDLPSTGEKGMWKQQVGLRIATFEWLLGQ